MKLLRQCAKIALTITAIATAVTAPMFDGPLTFVVWPGIVAMAEIYDRFGFDWEPRSRLLLLLPGFVINFAAYTIGFFTVGSLWRRLLRNPKLQTKDLNKDTRH